jgi:hypothetical protein
VNLDTTPTAIAQSWLLQHSPNIMLIPGTSSLAHLRENLAGDGSVERGTATYQVTVRELVGAERDRIYAEQARRYPGFAEYARQTAGVRTIPVLELRRA